jgi:hypothetical protein
MKTPAIVLASLLVLPLGAFCQTAVPADAVKLGKVAPEVVKTPEFNLSSGPTKRSKTGQWLEMEIDYETKAEEIDELTFKYVALIEKKLVTGEVTFVNIPKGREHFAVMYMSPRQMDKLTGGKPLTGASIENVWVDVEHQGQVLGKTSFKPGAVPNLPKTAGLLNKNQTPFAPLFYDRYEEVKASR